MNRNLIVEKYRKRYTEGIRARGHSLREYNYYLQEMRIEKGLEEIIKNVLLRKNKVGVFDIGCGEAQALHELKEIFGEKVCTRGMDIVKSVNGNVDEFILGDAVSWRWPAENDVIISFRALHEMGELKTILEKTCNGLSEKGMAFLSIRTRENGKLLDEIREVDIQFLKEILKHRKFKECTVQGKVQENGIVIIVQR